MANETEKTSMKKGTKKAASKSKFFVVLKGLYPAIFFDDSKPTIINPDELFMNKIFQITVVLKSGKEPDSPQNAVVVKINHPNVGW